MTAPPAILVPLDGSAAALAALPVAGTLGALEGAVLHILYVGPGPEHPRDLLLRLGLDPAAVERFVVHASSGDPVGAILDAARALDPLYLVICPYTRPTPPEDAIGSVARALFARADCPVVLVPKERGSAPWALRLVLLPWDGAPATAMAVRAIAPLAGRAGATMEVLHVAGAHLSPPAEPGTTSMPRYIDQPQHEWAAWSRELLDRLGCICDLPPEALRLSLATGDPAAEIARAAATRPVDLVVVGHRGRLEPERAQVVKRLLLEAPCPVLALRSEPAP